VHAVLLSVEQQQFTSFSFFIKREGAVSQSCSKKEVRFSFVLQFGDWVFLLLETTKLKASNHFFDLTNQKKLTVTTNVFLSFPLRK
jgi:hypothetical protein